MSKQKRIAAVHDISGIGKCSLTAALPVLSAAGIEAAVIPTAVLSTHTGGFQDFHYHDLTSDMMPVARHWKDCGFAFDAIYSGFLGSPEQVGIVSDMIDLLGGDGTLKLIDPAMADHGKLYTTFTPDFPDKMRRLAARADILTPNITELCLLTGTDYQSGPYSRGYIEDMLKHAGESIGCGKIVLTGVYFNEKQLGAAAFDRGTGNIEYHLAEKRAGFYHGTGDLFASCLLSGIMTDHTFGDSVAAAVDFIDICIDKTVADDHPKAYGVNFEQALPWLIKRLGIAE